MKFRGEFSALLIRRHRIVDKFQTKNAVVDVGLDHILDVQFLAGAQSTSWYLGLMDNVATLDNSDTMVSHGGWTELTTYNEATRPQWQPAAGLTPGTISNTLFADFTMNASEAIAGVFVADDSTKGGSTGNLWSTAKFSGGFKSVSPGDIVRVRYAVYADRA